MAIGPERLHQQKCRAIASNYSVGLNINIHFVLFCSMFVVISVYSAFSDYRQFICLSSVSVSVILFDMLWKARFYPCHLLFLYSCMLYYLIVLLLANNFFHSFIKPLWSAGLWLTERNYLYLQTFTIIYMSLRLCIKSSLLLIFRISCNVVAII